MSVSLPHCLHERPQYIHTGIGWAMGADLSQIFSMGSSPGVQRCTVPQRARGWYAYVQWAARVKLPCASGTQNVQETGA